jgi:hypothetical protein
MRYLEEFALGALVAGALLTLGAGSASAAEIYSTGVTLSGGTTIHMSLESGTSLLTSTTDGKTVIGACGGSTTAGTTTATSSEPISISIEGSTWQECTVTTHTLTNGSLTISASGVVGGSGSVWTRNFGGVSCRYGTGAGTTLGILKTGKLAINAVINEQAPNSFICPDTTKWVANYMVTSPHDLTVK